MKQTKQKLTLFLLVISLFIFTACQKSSNDDGINEGTLTIYTTIYPIQFLVEEIGGSTVNVKSVYPPGVDAHTFEPTTRDMTYIAKSDAFIYFGQRMEGFVASAAKTLADKQVTLVELEKYDEIFFPERESDEHHHHEVLEDHHDYQYEHVHHEHEAEDHHHHDENDDDSILIAIEGFSPHYHTGEKIKLSARLKTDDVGQDGKWQWFRKKPNVDTWEVVANNEDNTYEAIAEVSGEYVKVIYVDQDENVIAESNEMIIEIDDHDGERNPHVWIDPLRMQVMAEIIRDQLIQLNPSEKTLYEKNTNLLIEQLDTLHAEFVEILHDKQHKYIIVPHNAYSYWEERYGIEQIAVSGFSTTDEPSQKYLIEIIEKAKQYELDVVFFEQNTPNKLMNVIQEQIDAKTATLHNLSVLIDEDIANGEDYFSLMRKNLQTLDEFLR